MKYRVIRSIVPNMLTFANLFAGFTAIVHISINDFEKAAIFILMASIFDALDGVAARLVNATSEFGVELDSLCDAVSFGIAPAFMLYQVHFHEYGELGILLASLPALAGVARLASFNVSISGFDDKEYFRGLPIPASALFIISFVIFYYIPDNFLNEHKSLSVVTVSILSSLMMVSRIKFDNLPRPNKDIFKKRLGFLIFAFIGFVVSIISLGKLIFPIMLLYILQALIRYLYEKIKEHTELEDEFDEDDDNNDGFEN